MDVREKLVELLTDNLPRVGDLPKCDNPLQYTTDEIVERIADHLIAHGVTVQECAYWQYIEDDVDEDNNIQAYCSVCHAGDKHATSMIGRVPYCWKCGRKMTPQPPKEGE